MLKRKNTREIEELQRRLDSLAARVMTYYRLMNRRAELEGAQWAAVVERLERLEELCSPPAITETDVEMVFARLEASGVAPAVSEVDTVAVPLLEWRPAPVHWVGGMKEEEPEEAEVGPLEWRTPPVHWVDVMKEAELEGIIREHLRHHPGRFQRVGASIMAPVAEPPIRDLAEMSLRLTDELQQMGVLDGSE